jgi:hypothetical protein
VTADRDALADDLLAEMLYELNNWAPPDNYIENRLDLPNGVEFWLRMRSIYDRSSSWLIEHDCARDEQHRAAYEQKIEDFRLETLRTARIMATCRELLNRLDGQREPHQFYEHGVQDGMRQVAEEVLRVAAIEVARAVREDLGGTQR